MFLISLWSLTWNSFILSLIVSQHNIWCCCWFALHSTIKMHFVFDVDRLKRDDQRVCTKMILNHVHLNINTWYKLWWFIYIFPIKRMWKEKNDFWMLITPLKWIPRPTITNLFFHLLCFYEYTFVIVPLTDEGKYFPLLNSIIFLQTNEIV